ncbi:Rho termination factor N-terminal domain-containing protein [Micromonospora sp. PLK6-60]|uniref:Rho termination factor N-terminal domain-containing protein n=1 Tax=Micromonospora sp. PLK6-60 TaxID=2873383 RepID=UPI001CA6154C|nr:Rho termination factor N-terminal domain-containing protein [Micromonospora sp. PLK6-60]MBY8872375.1 Rho termination factor N-terminal domain-containing protein [Micromonospora sp. PLK6-60]
MTDPTRTALARVAEFLAGLTTAELTDLTQGRARLAVLPVADPPPSAPAPVGPRHAEDAPAPVPVGARRAEDRPAPAPVGARHAGDPPATGPDRDVERAHAALAAMSRRTDGTAYLAGWTARDLRALAARAGLRGVTGLRKGDLVERIVDRTIGFRLDSTAVRGR